MRDESVVPHESQCNESLQASHDNHQHEVNSMLVRHWNCWEEVSWSNARQQLFLLLSEDADISHLDVSDKVWGALVVFSVWSFAIV